MQGNIGALVNDSHIIFIVVDLAFEVDEILMNFWLTFSVKVAEEKLRYAAYNCIAIDTDMNPWGE